jgi:predicted  nucleic acid-binding Zn-ribbon protein
MKIYGAVAAGLTTLGLVAGVIWYIWKGKDLAQLKESEQGWKGLAQQKDAAIADLEKKVARLEANGLEKDKEIEDLKKELRGLAKTIARLQGEEEL